MSKGVHEPNFATCKSLCNLQKLCTALKEKHPNINIGFSKFCTLRPKWCLLDGSKMTHSVCVCGVHKNVALLVDAMDWKFSCKDLIKLTLSCLKYFHWILFLINFISPSLTNVFFFNWKITSSPYLEMLLISMIKLLFLFFLGDCNVQCCVL